MTELNIPTSNAPVAWSSGWNGTGVGLAMIDSGIRTCLRNESLAGEWLDSGP